MDPSRQFCGALALGIMSHSKIPVGSHKVAQALRDIDNTRNTSLHWCRAKNCIGLCVRVAEFLEIHRDCINFPALIEQVTLIFKEAAMCKGIDFRISLRESFPFWVHGDEKRLRQILINLLSTALRYTDAGSVHLEISYRIQVLTSDRVTNRYSQPVSRTKPFCWDTLSFSFPGVASERIMVKLRAGNDASNAVFRSNHFNLTEREAEVLPWLTRGKTNQDTEEILGISTRTINTHLERVFQKMGGENRTAAALLADRLLHS